MVEKDSSIETLRGIAIILVIGLHITNDGALTSAKPFYDYLAYTFQNIRMPLFTIISGYLYGIRPVYGINIRGFVGGKFRRVLIPLFVVATLEYLAKSTLPGVNNPTPIEEFWTASIYPYEHFWFLQVIFLIFIIYGIIGWVKWLPVWRNWLIFMMLSTLLFFLYPASNLSIAFFSIGGVTYLLPFFTLGFGLANYSNKILSYKYLWLWIFLFLVSFSSQQLLWFVDLSGISGKRTIIGLCVSLSAGCLLFYYRRSFSLLALIGSYAYAIYLYQGFGTSLARRLGFSDFGPHVYFVSVIIVTLIFGIIVEITARRIPYIRTLALGLKYKPPSQGFKNLNSKSRSG